MATMPFYLPPLETKPQLMIIYVPQNNPKDCTRTILTSPYLENERINFKNHHDGFNTERFLFPCQLCKLIRGVPCLSLSCESNCWEFREVM